jgi:hypothetical protein
MVWCGVVWCVYSLLARAQAAAEAEEEDMGLAEGEWVGGCVLVSYRGF